MKGNKTVQWLYRLLPIVLGMFLFAGMVGLLAPTTAQAEGTGSPPVLTADITDNMVGNLIEITFEDDQNWRTVIDAVYVDGNVLNMDKYNKDTAGKIIFSEEVFDSEQVYNIVIKAEGYLDASVTQKIEKVSLEIKGTGVTTPKKYTMSHLQGMEQYRHLYSTINTWPTKNWYAAEGVRLRALLEEAGIKDDAKQIRFTSGDGFKVTFTVQELLNDDRYLFPHFKDNHEYFGYILGSPDDAEKVEPILALKSTDSNNFNYMSDSDALHLIFGQRALTEQTNAVFAKKVALVEVLTDIPDKWAAPTATPAGGEVSSGTLVRLSSTNNNTDKVHYTLDGSEPTVASPMYNWVAQQWSSRSDFYEINHPIEITNNTTIKAVVIGPGKDDSDVVEFNYTVDGASAAPTAAFTADKTSGTVPLTVSFTDESTGTALLTYAWDFDNDGTVDSTEQNPTHEYGSAGTYSVKLTVTNASGSDDEVKTDYITVAEPSTMDVLYEGTVALAADETFTVTAYNSSVVYTVYETTPLGALQAAATAGGFTYDVTDKNYAASGALLLDNVGSYPYVKGGSKWLAYVNDAYKDGYNNADGALNLIELVNGDKVEFYYAAGITDPNNLNAVKAAATATVKTVMAEPTTIDVLYDGTVNLASDETFTVTAYNSGTEYTVDETTPLGALQAAATVAGFTYDVTDKNYAASGALLLDNVGSYPYVKGGSKWLAYVNDAYKDGYNNADGALNLIELVNGDKVEFYYAAGITDPNNLNAVKAAATAAVKTVMATGVTPTNWTLQLSGAKDATVTKADFEAGLACSSSGHQVFWTDEDGNEWGGVPLWLLVAMVDDDPDVGSDHYNFNDELAGQNYEVNVIAGDGWKATLDSADIARNDGYIVANTLNGEPLPMQTEGGKGCWPLHLKGSAVFGGQQVGNIVRIELTGLPQPPTGWTLEMIGDVGDTITQEEFEEGLACTGSGHYKEWTDNEGNVWSGVPLWVLLGAVDGIETSSHWTFNDILAADGYSVKVVAGDGFSKTFASADVARSDNYIVANECNGALLTDSGPLRLVGDGVTNDDGSLSGASVGNIVKIEIPDLQTPAAASGSWNLSLNGKISDFISQAEFEAGLACPNSGHLKEWTDGDGNVWSGIPLWLLTGWVDDRQPHNYNTNQAMAGYTVLVKAGDGYTKDFASTDVASSNDYIIANKCNGAPLTDSWPLRLVGAGVANEDGSLSGTSVGNIVEIELTSFETDTPEDIPKVHIVKYAEDGTTTLNEMTVDYLWMQENLDVIGDGTTVYRYEGITNNPDDVWDADETYPGGYKIANAVKGTQIQDLCDLVGGMGAGTEIVLIAEDGYETILPYSSIYTNPAVQERQGDAILAWWGDGKYVPGYADGMRLFFTPGGDNIYGQWDMHETLASNYWHYYYSGNVQYPSCAGLSSKNITEIKIYSVPEGDWTLELDGRGIGGINYDVSKTYFEQALACQFGANHKASYTDSEDRVWEGMPLWFLAGFVDDADQHSDNAFNDELAVNGYQVVITADDGYSVAIDSADIIRNSDYIIANSLNGSTIPDTDSNWPLRLVGPAVTGATSISQIVSIDLVSKKPVYTIAPTSDESYTVGTTSDGISTMTVNDGVSGFRYFTVGIEPVIPHSGKETVVFVHLRNGSQLELNAIRADFDQDEIEAQVGCNVQPGDVIKAYIVDELTNSTDHNPEILQ